jgi:hypothetical protein
MVSCFLQELMQDACMTPAADSSGTDMLSSDRPLAHARRRR